MKNMELTCDRVGKLALMAAMTNPNEELLLKECLDSIAPQFKLAITFISGLSSEIRKSFVRSVIACALENSIIKKTETTIHGLMHAALEAFEHVFSNIPAEASLKMKVAITTNEKWIAVAIYGDSAISNHTNHERAALGIMHL